MLRSCFKGEIIVVTLCKSIRTEMRFAVNNLLKDDGILVIPTTAYPTPKLGSKEIFSEDYQNCTFSLLSVASISGCCQVTLPLGVGYYDKSPVSVSFIARHGGDRFLLDTVQTMYSSPQDHAGTVISLNCRITLSSRNILLRLLKKRFSYAPVLEPTNQRAALSAERLRCFSRWLEDNNQITSGLTVAEIVHKIPSLP